MTQKYMMDGQILDHTPVGAVASGDVVVMGDTVGIALVAIAAGAIGAVMISGVFTVTKASGTAWVQGDKLDWDGAAGNFTKDKATPVTGDVSDCGIAAADAASGDTTGVIRLSPGSGTVT